MDIKLDWNDGDEFDIVKDYNRIKNNINELHIRMKRIYSPFDIVEILDKTDEDRFLLSYVNNLETNLQRLIDAINIPNMFEDTKIFTGNTSIWNTDDIIRIENTILLIKIFLDNISIILDEEGYGILDEEGFYILMEEN